MIDRRALLTSAAAFAAALPLSPARADDNPVPIVFVHGDGGLAATWQTTIWRFESNGYPRDRLFAISFTNPRARDDNDIPQPNRSSTGDELNELSAFVDDVRAKTGAEKVALVAESRGGNAVRNYIAHGGAVHVSHAVLGGTPNHGVFALPPFIVRALGGGGESEFNGWGRFLLGLNGGASETTPGVRFLTLRSDGNDLYAQPYGTYLGHPQIPTFVNADGPALKGATNIVLDHADHRETILSPLAFAETYAFIVGRAPARVAILPEGEVTLNGRVTGVVDRTATNLPVEDATVQVYATDPETGARRGEALVSRKTGADGMWGPLKTDSATTLEFVVAAPGAPVTHTYRSPFPRSSSALDLRPEEAPPDAGAGAIIIMKRARGYFGAMRDVIILDGRRAADVPPGAPSVWKTKLVMPVFEDRPIVAEFNEERIVLRPWPAKDNAVAIAELTY